MRRILLSAMVVLFFAIGITSERAEASRTNFNQACFDWQCDPITHECSFDAGCTTLSGGPPFGYRWDFGDGSVNFTQSAQISHSYPVGYFDVTLTVFPDLFNPEFSVACNIVTFTNVGPPIPPSGRCP